MVGQKIRHYHLLERLEDDEAGEIYLARDDKLDRRVLVRLLPSAEDGDATTAKRYLRGAKAAAALDHPFIAKVYETGALEGRGFLVTEYVHSETLEERLARETIPLREALRIASEIAEALEAAHTENIIHRDLSPANIALASSRHVKVMGFGLVKRIGPGSSPGSHRESASLVSEKDALPEAMPYASPEELRGEPADTRSDIFSLGLLLYRMLAGVHPFERETGALMTAASILKAATPPLSKYRKDTPDLLDYSLRKMLAKDPVERYQLVREVRTDLAHVQDRLPRQEVEVEVPGEQPESPVPDPPSFWRLGMAMLALLALGAALGAWWIASSSRWVPDEERPSLAVLPLVNESGDPFESDYLAEGISKAVITKLVQAGLQVTPWQTAVRYQDRGEPPEAIAAELGVRAVLTGTFQLIEDRLVATLSLMDAESGLLTWAEEFDEPYEDLFQVQRRIALGAATSLRTELSVEEEAAIDRPASRSLDAYDLYLQGVFIMQEGSEEALNIALDYFTRAVELDPDFAEAHVGVGATQNDRYYFGWAGLESLDLAQASYERALALQPALMTARRGLSTVHFNKGHIEGVMIQGREAARLGRPHDVETLLVLAHAYQHGGVTEGNQRAPQVFRRVLEIDPMNQEARWRLGTASWAIDNHLAIEAGNDYLRLFGDDPEIHLFMAHAHHLLGELERARQSYEKADLGRHRTLAGLFFAGLLYEQLGDNERAEENWRLGLEQVEPRLELYPDNLRLRLFQASFYGLLGDTASFRAAEERALREDFSPWEFHQLAAVHAKRGETEEAAELLRRGLRHGLVYLSWEAFFAMASSPFPETEAFEAFRREEQAEMERLRRLYY